jgi:peptidoglycan/LPS O-acetylase OafA/YrhL
MKWILLRGLRAMLHGSSNLDLLRSIAVFFVVLSHLLIEESFYGNGMYSTQTLGTLGVLIFFVHTCLVLMLSLERQAIKENQFPKTFPFLVARAFRIYPLSIVVVSLVAVSAWVSSDSPPSGGTVLSNLLLIQNLTEHDSIPPVLWSLPFELQMYLFLPALYMLVSLSGRIAPYCIGALWLAMVLVIFGVWRLGWNTSLVMFFPCFLPGVLAFCLRNRSRTLTPVVLFLFVGVLAIVFPWTVAHGVKATMLSWPICLTLGLLIPHCREIESVRLRRLSEVIARYSYGIYLVHVPMVNVSFHYLGKQTPVISWVVFFTGTACLSYFAYHTIEKPCTEFGRMLAERLKCWRSQQDSGSRGLAQGDHTE